MATPKQEKLIGIILENLGNEKPRTMGDMLKEAGYSEAIQKNPKMIFESETIQAGMSEVAKDLEILRKNALNELKSRDLEKEPMRDVVKAIDIFTKNHQLLSGGKTESNEMTISWKSQSTTPQETGQ